MITGHGMTQNTVKLTKPTNTRSHKLAPTCTKRLQISLVHSKHQVIAESLLVAILERGL